MDKFDCLDANELIDLITTGYENNSESEINEVLHALVTWYHSKNLQISSKTRDSMVKLCKALLLRMNT